MKTKSDPTPHFTTNNREPVVQNDGTLLWFSSPSPTLKNEVGPMTNKCTCRHVHGHEGCVAAVDVSCGCVLHDDDAEETTLTDEVYAMLNGLQKAGQLNTETVRILWPHLEDAVKWRKR